MPDHKTVLETTSPDGRDRVRDAAAGRPPRAPGLLGAWFMGRLLPDSAVQNRCRALHLSGPLDLRALRTAWHGVVARHPALRTTLSDVDGLPIAGPAADPDTALAVVDLSGDAGARFGTRECIGRWTRTPFDLTETPFVRLGVIRRGPRNHELVLVMHEMIADELSLTIVLDELAHRYEAIAAGADIPAEIAAPRPEPAVAGSAADLLWWIDRLTPIPPRATPATDRPRPAAPSTARGVVPFHWADLAPALRALATAGGTTAHVALLAGFQCLLHRHSGAERVAVGTTLTLRADARSATEVGPWDNLVVHVGDYAGNPTLGATVAASGFAADAAAQRRGVPFADVVVAVGAERDPRRTPLVDAVFRVHEPANAPPFTSVRARLFPVHSGEIDADLALTVNKTDGVVEGFLEYRRDLFDHATACLLVRQLRTLLAAPAETPVSAVPLDEPDPLAPAEARVPDEGATAVGLVVHRADQVPTGQAVVWTDGGTDYRGLVALAEGIAEDLRAAGIGRGDAVVVRVGPGPLRYAALLGVQAVGAHTVWFGTGDAGERGRTVLADLKPACALVDFEDTGLTAWYRDTRGGTVLHIGAGRAARRSGSPTAEPADRAYIAYTSGSTGTPKGIAQTQAALAQFARWMAAEFRMGPGSRVAQWVAPEHDPAIAEVFAALVSGAALCPVPERVRLHPERLAAWLADERITHLQLVPSFARELVAALAARAPAARPGLLGQVLLMGEAVPADLVSGLRTVLPGARLANLYGPTETIAATWHEIGKAPTSAAPIGLPIPGRRIILVDAEDRPCPTGVVGEIVIRTPYVTPGYIGVAGGSAAFRPVAGLPESGTYRTGDLGRRGPNGLLEFLGRKDFQVKLLGNRVELTEIEATLAEDPGVAECAVVAVANADGLTTGLVAHVVPAGSAMPSPKVWRARLRERFGALALPVVFAVRAERLPRNVTGKVDRNRLGAVHPVHTAPLGDTARALVRLWADLLDRPTVDAEDDFFAVGGTSLLLCTLHARIRLRFGAAPPLWRLLAARTPAGMSELIDATDPAQPRSTGTKE